MNEGVSPWPYSRVAPDRTSLNREQELISLEALSSATSGGLGQRRKTEKAPRALRTSPMDVRPIRIAAWRGAGLRPQGHSREGGEGGDPRRPSPIVPAPTRGGRCRRCPAPAPTVPPFPFILLTASRTSTGIGGTAADRSSNAFPFIPAAAPGEPPTPAYGICF